MKKLSSLALAGALVVGAAALWELTFGVQTVNHIHALVFFKQSTSLFWLLPPLFAGIVFFLCRKRVLLYEYIFRPLWLMMP